jgi:hypothetical protein
MQEEAGRQTVPLRSNYLISLDLRAPALGTIAFPNKIKTPANNMLRQLASR